MVCEKELRDVLSGASAPWLRSCVWAQALAISPCLSCVTDTVVPGYILCWSHDCLADLTSQLGLGPLSSLRTFLCNFITVVLIWEVIQQAVELVNPGLLWIRIHYNSFPPPLASSTQKTPGLPSLCLQDLTCIKSLSSQPTLPPHLHHASEPLTTQDSVRCDCPTSALTSHLCWGGSSRLTGAGNSCRHTSALPSLGGHPFAQSLQKLHIFIILYSSAKFALHWPTDTKAIEGKEWYKQ